MTSPRRILLLAAASSAMVLLALRGLAPSETPRARTVAVATPAASLPTATPPVTPVADGAGPGDKAQGDLVSYSVALHELHGLPPNAAPGTRLQVWVAWEPPITKQPRIDRLVEEVVLEEISPPLLPDGPHVATLLVNRGQFRDLLYGDRYGSLSVGTPQN